MEKSDRLFRAMESWLHHQSETGMRTLTPEFVVRQLRGCALALHPEEALTAQQRELFFAACTSMELFALKQEYTETHAVELELEASRRIKELEKI